MLYPAELLALKLLDYLHSDRYKCCHRLNGLPERGISYIFPVFIIHPLLWRGNIINNGKTFKTLLKRKGACPVTCFTHGNDVRNKVYKYLRIIKEFCRYLLSYLKIANRSIRNCFFQVNARKYRILSYMNSASWYPYNHIFK